MGIDKLGYVGMKSLACGLLYRESNGKQHET